MKKNIIVIAICLLWFNQGIAQSQKTNVDADDILEALIEEKGIVGVTAGYSIDGKTIWTNAFGYSSKKDKTPYTTATIGRTASIAKSMTAIAIMQLVEKELIDLDIPIQHYLPKFPKKERGEITARQLLCHTSGIKGYGSNKEAENKAEYTSLAVAMTVFQNRELAFAPGSQFQYTTYGYVVLGRLIEVVSGMTYEDYMQKNIWRIAGMTETGVEDFHERLPNSSQLYHKKRKKAKLAKRNNLSNRTPGGGFYSTLGDLIKFGEAILNNSFIKKSTLDEMLQPASPGKEGNQYGLGFYLYGPKGQEGGVFGHSGGQTGTACQFFIRPSDKTVVVVLGNTSGTWEHIVGAAALLLNLPS